MRFPQIALEDREILFPFQTSTGLDRNLAMGSRQCSLANLHQSDGTLHLFFHILGIARLLDIRLDQALAPVLVLALALAFWAQVLVALEG